jgi:hypothetical protein
VDLTIVFSSRRLGETKSLREWVRDPRATVGPRQLHERLFNGYPPGMPITHPSNLKTEEFWDVKRRGIDIPAERSEVAVLPAASQTDVDPEQLSEKMRMRRRFEESISANRPLPSG